MNNSEYSTELARAWLQHRQGNQEAAIKEFQVILGRDANHIDALFGLGLAQRSNGQKEAARENFLKAGALVKSALEQKPGEDRYEMLVRIIEQRIAELSA